MTREPEAPESLTGNYFIAAYPPFSCWDTSMTGALEDALARPAGAAPIGIYVHVPFCDAKCRFCYFLSYTTSDRAARAAYVDRLLAEAADYARRPAVAGRPVRVLYVGGGTPSVLEPNEVERLLSGLKRLFPFDRSAELTFECAPRSVSSYLVDVLEHAGITRVSMGVQSFDDGLLAASGRIHRVVDITQAWQLFRARSFPQINLDLMVGLPGDTRATWERTIASAIRLFPERITIYQTEVPLNTALYRAWRDGAVETKLLDWDEKRERLDLAFTILEEAGYTVVSSFAVAADPRRHEFTYCDHLWRGGDLVGLGVSAFGYIGGVHYQNHASLEDHARDVAAQRLPLKRAYALTARDRLIREFVLQLKWGEVRLAEFTDKFGCDPARELADPLSELSTAGFLALVDGCVRLTRPGLLRVDRLLPHFYDRRFRGVRYS